VCVCVCVCVFGHTLPHWAVAPTFQVCGCSLFVILYSTSECQFVILYATTRWYTIWSSHGSWI